MTQLRAGPLRMELDGADLRYIRLGRYEVVRRLYVAVRDPHWNTVPSEVSNHHLELNERSFRVSFTCTHRQDAIAFRWQGTLTGDADGTIHYVMDGQAESTFEHARIGICVLPPINPCAGAPFRVTHPDGSVEDGVLPRLISPHQPVMDIAHLDYPIDEDGWAGVRFEGDVFEMEDQRNWTDASFKIYSTPLRMQYPVVVEHGTRIEQRVTLRVRPRDGWSEPPAATDPPQLVIGSPTGRLPTVGVGLGAVPLAPEVVGRLRALRVAHLRVDLDGRAEAFAGLFERAAEAARAAGAALEIALTLGEQPEATLDALARRAAELRPSVARWVVLGAGAPSTSPALVRLARERLGGGAPVGGGSDTHFTELNRNRPALDGWDFVSYPIMPQAHAFDELSIMETLQGQPETVASARAFVAQTPIVIAPVTLRRRNRPGEHAPTWPASDWRSADDPRQALPFAAAWTLGSLGVLAQAGIASVTFFEASGARGIMADNGDPYPVYQVLAAVADFAGAQVLPGESSDPLRVCGFAVRDGTREQVLIANLTVQPTIVRVRGIRNQREVHLDAFGTHTFETEPTEVEAGRR